MILLLGIVLPGQLAEAHPGHPHSEHPERGAGITLIGIQAPGVSVAQDGDGKSVIIQDVHVPGEDGSFSPETVTVGVERGRVKVWGTREEVESAGIADATTIEGGGGYLISGLVDAHVHIGVNAGLLPRMIQEGVTGAIDLATDAAVARQAEETPMDVRLVGPVFTSRNGHGTEPQYKLEPVQIEQDWTDSDVLGIARREIAALRGAGFTSPWEGIKIIYDNQKYPPGGRPETCDNISRDHLQAVMKGAVESRAGRIHVHLGYNLCREVLEAAIAVSEERGQKFSLVLEHWEGSGIQGTTFGEPLAPLLARARARVDLAIVPTYLRMIDGLKTGAEVPPPPGAGGGRPSLEQILDWSGRALRHARELGIPIYAGTDLEPGIEGNLADELIFLAKQLGGGRDTHHYLLKAAARPHQALPRSLLERGQVANLIILRSDPIADLASLKEDGKQVFIRGDLQTASRNEAVKE